MIANAQKLDEAPLPVTGRPTALVLDDLPESGRATARMLERSGFVAFTARSAREGAQIAAELNGPLDLLVSEVTFLGTQGLLTQLERTRGLKPSTLYTSGRSRDELHARGFRGPDGILIQKPFTDAKLAEGLWALLGL